MLARNVVLSSLAARFSSSKLGFVLSQRAQVLLEIDRVWDAVQAATEACRCAPQWDAAHLTLARAQLCFGEPRLALSSMDTALGCLLMSETTDASALSDIQHEAEEVESILLRQDILWMNNNTSNPCANLNSGISQRSAMRR